MQDISEHSVVVSTECCWQCAGLHTTVSGLVRATDILVCSDAAKLVPTHSPHRARYCALVGNTASRR